MPEFSSPIDLGLSQNPAGVPDELYEEFQKIYSAIRTLHTKFGDYSGLLTTNPTNFLDISQLPKDSIQSQRFNAIIATARASSLVAGQLVFLVVSAGILEAYKADASAGVQRWATGWVPYDIGVNTKGIIYLFTGYNGGFGGLSGGGIYYLSATTPGGITTTAPVASGTLRQQIGTAISASDLFMTILGYTINP